MSYKVRIPKAISRIFLATFILIVFSGLKLYSQNYCNPTFYIPMGITALTIKDGSGATLLSYSGCTYPGYLSPQTTSLSVGQTYTFSVTGGNYYCAYGLYYQYWRIFLDANSSGFNTTPTLLAQSSGYMYTFNGTFSLPATGTSGVKRLRIVGAYYGYGQYPNACGYVSYYGGWVDYDVTCQWVQPYDIGVQDITSPAANGWRFTQPQDVTMVIKNFSSKQPVTSFDYSLAINSVNYSTTHWTGLLDTGATTTITIPQIQFTPTAPWGPFSLDAWTSNPLGNDPAANSQVPTDGKPSNDHKLKDVSPILNDAGFIDADAMIPITPGINNVQLKIKNYAPKPLTSCRIFWYINGAPQTPYDWTGFIEYDSSKYVTVGNYLFGAGNLAYQVSAKTSIPNGLADDWPANDSNMVEVYKALPGGTYTIGATQSDYPSLIDAIDFINFWGIAGQVEFVFRPGSYDGGVTINPRGNAKYPIIFRSITGSSYDVNINACDMPAFILDNYSNLTFKDLTFNATCTGSGNLILMRNGNNNISITNCVFNGVADAPQSSDFAMINSQTNLLNNITINDNTFRNGSVAMWLNSNIGNPSSNITILRNNISNPSFAGIEVNSGGAYNADMEENNIYGSNFNYGIFLTGAGTIKNNRINGVIGSGDDRQGGIFLDNSYPADAVIDGNSVSGYDCQGVGVFGFDNLVTITNNTLNMTGDAYSYYTRAGIFVNGVGNGSYTPVDINRNIIKTTDEHGIYTSYTNGNIIYNKVILTSTYNNMSGFLLNASGGLIADNMVSALGSSYGVNLQAPVDANFFYNTFYNNDRSLPTMVFSGLGGAGSNLFRNIFYNDGTGPVVFVENSGSFNADYNDLYTNGPEFAHIDNGEGYDVIPDLAAWQNATAGDANSVSEIAYFRSNTDMRLTQLDPLLYTGFASPDLVPEIAALIEAKDYEGEARTTQFYMGADEVNPTISITLPPAEIVGCYGSTDQMLVVAANIDFGGTLTYQWQKDGVNLTGPGSTDPIYYFGALKHELSGVYKCIITGNGGAKTIETKPVLVYTLSKTEITREPADVYVDAGGVAAFELDVHIYENEPLQYQPTVQWYRDTVALTDNERFAGTNSSMMTVKNIKAIDYASNYSVRIGGLCGSDTSRLITLTDKPKLTLLDLDSAVSVCEGENTTLTLTATVNKPGIVLKYQWRKNNVPLDIDGHIAGTNTPSLIISGVVSGDAGNYDVVVTTDKGGVVATSTVTILSVKLKPYINTEPDANINVQTGKQLQITVDAAGNAPLNYAWFKDGIATGDSTNTLTKVATMADAGTYYCHIWNDCGDIMTKTSVVNVTTLFMMGVEETMAGEFGLLAAKPNPFGNETEIGIVAPRAANVKLVITDLFGKEIAVLLDGTIDAGFKTIKFNAATQNLSSGVYYYTMSVDGNKATRQMTVIR